MKNVPHSNNQMTKPRARPMGNGVWYVHCQTTGIAVSTPGFDAAVAFYYDAAAYYAIDQEWKK